MSEQPHARWKILWILPPLILGMAFLMFMKSGKQPPQQSESGEPVRTVRIHMVRQADFVPVAQGYGEVTPAQVWKAIAQVSGRIIRIHPRLKNGEIIQQGETLLQIDPVDYELNLVQAQTQLAELEVQQQNTKSSLEIELRNLALARKEYQRLQKLVEKGSVSQSSADAAERTMLSSTAQVQNLKNTLSLIPSQKKLQRAKITQAERDLANARISAPFNLRVSALAVEADQYVSTGQSMFSGDSIDRVEIIAQVALSTLKNLFIEHVNGAPDMQNFTANLSDFTGFRPTVRLDMGNDQYAEWEAEFVRFSDAVDTQTRTLGVVVAVNKPLSKIIPGRRPPLSKGMFVEVSIAGHTQPASIAIPRASIRNGKVYLVDTDDRLLIRAVTRKYDQGDLSIISSGLQEGNRVVLTDLIPAIEGMLLHPLATLDFLPAAGE